ncbi:MAG: serine/threonine-protein kinase [Gemmatirosa sp.]
MSLIRAIERRLPLGYTIQGQIGSGATSWVYLARGDGDAPALVVKVMHPGMSADANVDRFVREMRILRTLDHPRIIPILEPGEADGALFFTMPYVPGETLRVRLDRTGPLPIREALVIARDVTEALGHAHGRGVVHRDVKPANILLADGRAFLMDFGFANAPSLTTPNAAARDARLAIGTPEYISPEQVTGRRAEDWRSDFFSLACVLQEMLTGAPPFTGGAPRAVMQRRLTEAPADLRAARPDVPVEVAAIVRRNLAVSPNDRFATAGFFRLALESAIERIDAAPHPA